METSPAPGWCTLAFSGIAAASVDQTGHDLPDGMPGIPVVRMAPAVGLFRRPRFLAGPTGFMPMSAARRGGPGLHTAFFLNRRADASRMLDRPRPADPAPRMSSGTGVWNPPQRDGFLV